MEINDKFRSYFADLEKFSDNKYVFRLHYHKHFMTCAHIDKDPFQKSRYTFFWGFMAFAFINPFFTLFMRGAYVFFFIYLAIIIPFIILIYPKKLVFYKDRVEYQRLFLTLKTFRYYNSAFVINANKHEREKDPYTEPKTFGFINIETGEKLALRYRWFEPEVIDMVMAFMEKISGESIGNKSDSFTISPIVNNTITN